MSTKQICLALDALEVMISDLTTLEEVNNIRAAQRHLRNMWTNPVRRKSFLERLRELTQN